MSKLLGMLKRFFREEDGMGTIEIILIIVVLIALVLIFREQILGIVDDLFSKVTSSVDKF
ncbi:MAG: holin, BlyA family protein [Lachnospiraceae bacterium]|nr:holin, BlyA family protein [Lachnospiraceae bacterium]MBR2403134.1 holin, BlyA family protein [Lachnospiraceae bacterium]